MAMNTIDLGGQTVICEDIKVGATRSGQAGTSLSSTELTLLDGVTAGTATASKVLTVDANKELDWTYTSSSTSGSTSVEPLTLASTLTGVGGVGGRAKFSLTSNVALGGWSNALKAEMTYGASGRTTGLGSAFVAEMTLSAGTSSGTYAPLEIELNLGTSASTGTQTSFAYMSVNGAAAGTFDTNGGIFSINGVTINSGKVIQAAAVSDIDSTHAMRIFINGTAYYIPLHTSATFAP